ncbi:MAG: hypothetical protein K7J46_08425 [Bryobacter sp.]|nr:hypothetical protein [Bryobacter sp. CoA8 C33]
MIRVEKGVIALGASADAIEEGGREDVDIGDDLQEFATDQLVSLFEGDGIEANVAARIGAVLGAETRILVTSKKLRPPVGNTT